MATTLSGQITITTAGTAVKGTDAPGGLFSIKPHHDNTDVVWVGHVTNDVTNANGFVLNVGESLVIELANLNQLYFDADVNGAKICWIKLN